MQAVANGFFASYANEFVNIVRVDIGAVNLPPDFREYEHTGE
jgi:hypothetical protein